MVEHNTILARRFGLAFNLGRLRGALKRLADLMTTDSCRHNPDGPMCEECKTIMRTW